MSAIAVKILPAGGWGEILIPEPGSVTVIAFLVTVALSLFLTKRTGLDMRASFWACVYGVVGALLGGWLWTLMLGPHSFFAEVMRSSLLGSDKSMLGAMIGASLAAGLYLRVSRNPLLEYADTLVPALFIGYVVVRLSCLLAGCCYGSPTDLPWGIEYVRGSEVFQAQVAAGLITPMASQSLKVHPVPLYHAAIGLFLYWATRRARGRPGLPIVIAFAGYGALRFQLEFFRGDALQLWHHLDLNHLASILLVLAGSGYWILQTRQRTLSVHVES